ncbi:FecR family protein [Chitinophaga terrae (ex Kim and Jung 2007)]|uniref:FecR family protein n=1 Tax=Chitinophaga terrae (ex Kim and Jung 2007) TaxID=408074 RepID=A0A1H3ZG99_9BACT|nr:FecR domain-containing protein [Chitinophaga terrae (ex Kim and Jung 2007)]GEP88740.1 anti-sigma factor [Chitinophaga terrae (ex Kim and Jung 2007)]SEA22773.1 FecR family protein [Chitinophaga terrae (ex Kim and Jung 2007)]
MNNTELKALIAKYLDGLATAEEKQRVEAWYQSFDTEQGLTDQLDAQQQEALQQQMYGQIDQAIASQSKGGRGLFIRYRYLVAAAAMLLLVIAGGALYYSRKQPAAQPIVMATATGNNIARKVKLPDGSLMWLNANSKVKFEQGRTADSKREVWISGEAYFEVQQQTNLPFLVHAGDITVQVLGTSFNVDAYESAKLVAVTVNSGKVAVNRDQSQKAVLLPDEQLVYDLSNASFVKKQVSAKDMVTWTTGQLIFKKQLFKDIAARLERRYNVHIEFDNEEVANGLLTASFDEQVALPEVLDMLCRVYRYSWRKENNVYRISGMPVH